MDALGPSGGWMISELVAHLPSGLLLLLLSHFSCVQLFLTPWTVAHQAPLSMGFSRQEYWSGLPLLHTVA